MKYRAPFRYACENVGIKNNKELVKELYLSGKSSNEIVEYFFEKHNITVSSRTILQYVTELGIKRSFSEAKKLAMKSGRMVYRKKDPSEKYYAKSISAGIRLIVLQRDNFTCQYCGNGRHTGHSLELHHKEGEESTPDNLITLCFLCHRGLHDINKEEVK